MSLHIENNEVQYDIMILDGIMTQSSNHNDLHDHKVHRTVMNE